MVSPGEISVLDLAQRPLNPSEIREDSSEKQRGLKTLATLHDIGKVAQEFQKFHRDNIESGKIFDESQFGGVKNRADKALIRDLKTVRRELIQAGLSGQKLKFAHALIGRSIFIRYLEDRGILTQDYFLKVARQTAGWTELIRNQSSRTGLDFSECQAFYPRVLDNKKFTYLFVTKNLHKRFSGGHSTF